jgi:hypothetical protein
MGRGKREERRRGAAGTCSGGAAPSPPPAAAAVHSGEMDGFLGFQGTCIRLISLPIHAVHRPIQLDGCDRAGNDGAEIGPGGKLISRPRPRLWPGREESSARVLGHDCLSRAGPKLRAARMLRPRAGVSANSCWAARVRESEMGRGSLHCCYSWVAGQMHRNDMSLSFTHFRSKLAMKYACFHLYSIRTARLLCLESR